MKDTFEQTIYDAIVIGGGPGGSTAATLIAKRGNRVLLLEKEHFPRYQIGESLLPVTVHGICELLGVREDVEAAGFIRKHGGTFKWGKSDELWTFAFGTNRYLKSYSAGYAYQVERSKFDHILLNGAKRQGVEVREGCHVQKLVKESGRVVGVRFRDEHGTSQEVRARYVVGASGNSASLYQDVGQRVRSEFFQNLAMFGYFEGVKRLPSPNDGNILCVAFADGWFWQIPIQEDLCSIGVVVSEKLAHRLSGDKERAFWSLIDESPEMKMRMQDARRIRSGQYGQIRVRQDYSYSSSHFWQPGIVLVGDAACFIDPVFSSGVHLATYSGLLAARSINTILESKLDEQTSLNEFERRYRREYGVFYDFLVGFYDMHQDTGSYYWNARKILQSDEQANEAFIRLVAGAGTTAEDFFEPRESIGARFESYKNQRLGGKTPQREADKTAVDLPSILEGMSQEESQIWYQAQHGQQRRPDAPVFSDGLSPTSDGLAWRSGNNFRR